MPDIRDIVRSKLKVMGGQGESDPTSIDEVKKAADHIKIVSEVQETASKLVGLDKLQKEKKEMEQQLEQTRAELEKQKMETINKELAEIKAALKAATENRDIPAIKELERRLEEARDAYHKEQLESLRREITEVKKGGTGGITEDVERLKSLKEASKELGLGDVSQTPPDILLQLKQMENNLQIQIETMKDDRDRRDKEWQLTIKKWDEERELRREEASQKYEAEHERTEVIKSAIDRGARIIGRTVMEEEEVTPSRPTSYHIEAEQGEMGEFTCPKCSSPVSIAPDTATAICAGCGFKAKVTRKAKSET